MAAPAPGNAPTSVPMAELLPKIFHPTFLAAGQKAKTRSKRIGAAAAGTARGCSTCRKSSAIAKSPITTGSRDTPTSKSTDPSVKRGAGSSGSIPTVDSIRPITVAAMLLTREPCVAVAMDGAEGIASARSGEPDLILMDMSLPVVNGWDATREIKAAPETGDIPIIALTAHAMAGDREKAVEAGCDEFETKPVDLPRLLEKIEALLGTTSGR